LILIVGIVFNGIDLTNIDILFV